MTGKQTVGGGIIVLIVVGAIIYSYATHSTSTCSNPKFTTKEGCKESGAEWGTPKEKTTPSSNISANNTSVNEKTKKGVVEQICTTPCSMNLGFGKLLWTKEKPILFRKKGEGAWVNFSGFRNETGDFEFKSPDPKNEVTIEVTSK